MMIKSITSVVFFCCLKGGDKRNIDYLDNPRGASGLSATGANQIIKQLGKGKGDKNDASKK